MVVILKIGSTVKQKINMNIYVSIFRTLILFKYNYGSKEVVMYVYVSKYTPDFYSQVPRHTNFSSINSFPFKFKYLNKNYMVEEFSKVKKNSNYYLVKTFSTYLRTFSLDLKYYLVKFSFFLKKLLFFVRYHSSRNEKV